MRSYPKDTDGLANPARIRRLLGELEAEGVEVSRGGRGGRRPIPERVCCSPGDYSSDLPYVRDKDGEEG